MFNPDFSGSDYCPGNYEDFEFNNNVVEKEWRKEYEGARLVPVQNMGSHNYFYMLKKFEMTFGIFSILPLDQYNGSAIW